MLSVQSLRSNRNFRLRTKREAFHNESIDDPAWRCLWMWSSWSAITFRKLVEEKEVRSPAARFHFAAPGQFSLPRDQTRHGQDHRSPVNIHQSPQIRRGFCITFQQWRRRRSRRTGSCTRTCSTWCSGTTRCAWRCESPPTQTWKEAKKKRWTSDIIVFSNHQRFRENGEEKHKLFRLLGIVPEGHMLYIIRRWLYIQRSCDVDSSDSKTSARLDLPAKAFRQDSLCTKWA